MTATATTQEPSRAPDRLAAPGWLLTLCLVLSTSAHAATPGQRCEAKAAAAMRSCAKAVAKQTLRCHQSAGAGCLANDPKIASARATLQTKALAVCPDAVTVAAAGYPAALTPAGLVARLQEICESAPASLAARTFGGPYAAVRTVPGVNPFPCAVGSPSGAFLDG